MLLYWLGCLSVEDTGIEAAIEKDPPQLMSVPSWRSTDWGYATGAGRADFDRDGWVDVVSSYGNDMSQGAIAIYFNHGNGLSTEADWISEREGYYAHLSVGDVNGDGWSDIVVSRFLGLERFDSPGGVEVYLNKEGGFLSVPDWEFSGVFTFSNALGDLDQDGDLDLAVAVGEPYYNEPQQACVFENDGLGDFGSAPVWMADSQHTLDVAWGDRNGDQLMDLLLVNDDAPHLWYDNIEGGLAQEPSWIAPGDYFEGNSAALGDIDGDGVLDWVISETAQQRPSGLIRAWCGGELCFELIGDSADHFSAISLVDVDADSDLELIYGSWWGALRAHVNEAGVLSEEFFWNSNSSRMVAEKIIWMDSEIEHQRLETWTGTGAKMLNENELVLSIEGGVACSELIASSGNWSAEVLIWDYPSLLLTDWEPESGNWLFEQR